MTWTERKRKTNYQPWKWRVNEEHEARAWQVETETESADAVWNANKNVVEEHRKD